MKSWSAVGRAPNVEGLGLEAAGIVYDRKGVQVNDTLQTSNPRVYAAGDICFPYKFTHTADALARILIANALFMGRQKSIGPDHSLVHLHRSRRSPMWGCMSRMPRSRALQ